jgi:di/tricarboxylate transporter
MARPATNPIARPLVESLPYCLFLICTIHLYYCQISLTRMQDSRSSRSTKVSQTKLIGLILGPVLFFILLVSPAPEGLPDQGKQVAGITLWLVVWWVTEAVSIYATALLPLALFPITGVLSLRAVGAECMSPIIILLLGMVLVVLAVEKSGLQLQSGLVMIHILKLQLLQFLVVYHYLSYQKIELKNF